MKTKMIVKTIKYQILKLHKSSKEPFDDIADDDTRLHWISEYKKLNRYFTNIEID